MTLNARVVNKMKSIKPEDFFKKVALNSNVSDLSLVRDVFYGMIRTISQELKSNHIVKLPDWGEFTIKLHKARNFVGVRGEKGRLPAKPTVKFSPDRKVKEYFYALGSDSTVVK